MILFLVACLILRIKAQNGTNPLSCPGGWTPVTRNEKIHFRPSNNNSLEIMTNSVVGGERDERIKVNFYSKYPMSPYGWRTSPSGGVIINFTPSPSYNILECSPSLSSKTNFTVTLPSATEKVWRITFYRYTAGTREEAERSTRLVIHCNNEKVANVLLDEYCRVPRRDWNKAWNLRQTALISFAFDTASDYYRKGIKAVECSGLNSDWNLNSNWKNLEADKEFPVDAGTVLNLSCEEGYELSGDSKVTCMKDNEFAYNSSSKPICSRIAKCYGIKEIGKVGKHMEADKEFPVNVGTVLNLSCEEGYEQSGDNKVTCSKDGQFAYSSRPLCSEPEDSVAVKNGLPVGWIVAGIISILGNLLFTIYFTLMCIRKKSNGKEAVDANQE